MVSGEDSGFPQVSFGQPENGGQPNGGGQTPDGGQPGYSGSGYSQPGYSQPGYDPAAAQPGYDSPAAQPGHEAGNEVPPSTWLPPTTPPSSPGGGHGNGPQRGPNYPPGYGTGAGSHRYDSGPGFNSGYNSGYGPGYGPDPNMSPGRNLLAYAAMRWRTRRRRRTIWLAVVGVWVVIAVIIGAVANGGSSDNSGGSDNWNPPTGVVKGATGTALTLYGFESGEKMSVTLTKVIPDAQPGDQFSAPKKGDRLYAAQFRLTDTGSASYSDSPSNGAAVVDAAGQSYSSTLMADSAAGCPMFSAVENIGVGGSGLGCIVFEVPANVKIVAVRFTLDSGLAQQTGQWSVAG